MRNFKVFSAKKTGIPFALTLSFLATSAFADCEVEKQARDALKGTQNTLNQASAWTVIGGMAGGAAIGGPVGALGGLLGAIPGLFGKINNDKLNAAEARLSECLGAITRANIVAQNRAKSNAELLSDLTQSINRSFTERKQEIDHEFNHGVQGLNNRAIEEGLDLEDNEVRQRITLVIDQLRAVRDQQLAKLDEQRISELSKPIESVTAGRKFSL